MREYRVRPRTEVSQGYEVTSNTRIDQSVNQTGNKAPTLISPQVKNSNLGSYKNIVHLCDEVPHDLPKGQMLKPIKI